MLLHDEDSEISLKQHPAWKYRVCSPRAFRSCGWLGFGWSSPRHAPVGSMLCIRDQSPASSIASALMPLRLPPWALGTAAGGRLSRNCHSILRASPTLRAPRRADHGVLEIGRSTSAASGSPTSFPASRLSSCSRADGSWLVSLCGAFFALNFSAGGRERGGRRVRTGMVRRAPVAWALLRLRFWASSRAGRTTTVAALARRCAAARRITPPASGASAGGASFLLALAVYALSA